MLDPKIYLEFDITTYLFSGIDKTCKIHKIEKCEKCASMVDRYVDDPVNCKLKEFVDKEVNLDESLILEIQETGK